MLLPGLLVAATGVGAGDLITASLAGSALGVELLWAVWVGALLKGVLTEGLARWQLATGTTLLEGWARHLGAAVQWGFLAYLLLWSFVVAGAMMSACGVAAVGLFPPDGGPEELARAKAWWGAAHGVVGLLLVRLGGFRVFEVGMSVCVGLMFVAVVATAALVGADGGELARGLLVPAIPADGVGWTLGLLGGVGGTVTLLSYGYWIREHGREGERGARECRLDLGAAYAVTALFGVAMVVIGARTEVTGGGAGVALALAAELEGALGPAGARLFLIGFWGAVFSSLLGVWQSVPYLFADFLAARRGAAAGRELARTRGYRAFQLGLVIVPMATLGLEVRAVQLAYAVLGALFMPFLAATLLVLNNRTAWVGQRFKNGIASNVGLVVTLAVFVYAGLRQLQEML